LHERVRGPEGGAGLRVAPVVEHSDLLRAGDGAARRARLLGAILVFKVLAGVFLEGNGGISALLRAVVNQPILADLEVAAADSAAPLVPEAA
jgi:hypothetical protein